VLSAADRRDVQGAAESIPGRVLVLEELAGLR
jgi:hypothetical protein